MENKVLLSIQEFYKKQDWRKVPFFRVQRDIITNNLYKIIYSCVKGAGLNSVAISDSVSRKIIPEIKALTNPQEVRNYPSIKDNFELAIIDGNTEINDTKVILNKLKLKGIIIFHLDNLEDLSKSLNIKLIEINNIGIFQKEIDKTIEEELMEEPIVKNLTPKEEEYLYREVLKIIMPEELTFVFLKKKISESYEDAHDFSIQEGKRKVFVFKSKTATHTEVDFLISGWIKEIVEAEELKKKTQQINREDLVLQNTDTKQQTNLPENNQSPSEFFDVMNTESMNIQKSLLSMASLAARSENESSEEKREIKFSVFIDECKKQINDFMVSQENKVNEKLNALENSIVEKQKDVDELVTLLTRSAEKQEVAITAKAEDVKSELTKKLDESAQEIKTKRDEFDELMSDMTEGLSVFANIAQKRKQKAV